MKKILATKSCFKRFFSITLVFLKTYSKPYILLTNLVANKIDKNTVNDDERDFVFDLMKGYNASSIFKKKEELKI